MKYIQRSKAERDKSIAHYFQKTLATDNELEAMMMYARNLVEVLTTELYILHFKQHPYFLKKHIVTQRNGKEKTIETKNVFANYKKINDLDRKEKIPSSVTICLNALAGAGNVSVHGSEILDEILRRPFRDLFVYLCGWYYKDVLDKPIPKKFKIESDFQLESSEEKPEEESEEYEWVDIDNSESVIKLQGGKGGFGHNDFTISVLAKDTSRMYGGRTTSSKSCTFNAGSEILIHENSLLLSGDIVQLASENKKLVIHFNKVAYTWASRSGVWMGEGHVQLLYRIYERRIKKLEKPKKKKK